MPQLTVFMSFQEEGAEGRKGGEETAADISGATHMLILLSEAKFSIADSMRHVIYFCLWHTELAPLCL